MLRLEVNNTTKYDDYLVLIENEHDYVETEKKKFTEKANEWVPKLREALKEEKISNEDIKDRILKDCLQYWTRQTIMNNLGDEFKDEKLSEAGKKGAKKKEEIAVTNSGDTEINKQNDDNRAGIPAKIPAQNEDKDKDTDLINSKIDLNENAELKEEISILQTLNKSITQSYEDRIKQLEKRVYEIPKGAKNEYETTKQLLFEEREKVTKLQKENEKLEKKLVLFHEIKEVDFGFDAPLQLKITVNPLSDRNKIASVTVADSNILNKIKKRLGI